MFGDGGRAAETAKPVGRRNFGFARRTEPWARIGRCRSIKKPVALLFSSEHQFEFSDHRRIALAGLRNERLPLVDRTLQGRLEHFSDAAEVLRRDAAFIAIDVHKTSSPGIADIAWRRYHMAMNAETPASEQITAWLTDWRAGDVDASERLFAAVYPKLRRIAAR